MNKHSKKMIAPIIITVLFILYIVIYFTVLIEVIPFLLLKILFIIIPSALSISMIFILAQRIKEIKGGQEDDLSKY